MRPTPNLTVEKWRVRAGDMGTSRFDGNNGAFDIPNPHDRGTRLVVIVSDGLGWDHVSVSVREGSVARTPTWDEMCYVKGLFFGREECVVQYHPPESEYVNYHEHVLHLWRPQRLSLPLPDSIMVGPKRGDSSRDVARRVSTALARGA